MLGTMKTMLSIGIGVILAGACSALLAGPAPWYKWRSKINGKQFCAQTSLGHGWERASGPYQDSHCAKLAAAK